MSDFPPPPALLRARSIILTVDPSAVTICKLGSFFLKQPVTYQKSGGDAVLQVNLNTGEVTPNAALAGGSDLTISGYAQGADGCRIAWVVVVHCLPALGVLALSAAIAFGIPSNGTITGATLASVISSNVPGLTINSAARTFNWDGSGAVGMVANGLVETLLGIPNSPRSNPVAVVLGGIGEEDGILLTTEDGEIIIPE